MIKVRRTNAAMASSGISRLRVGAILRRKGPLKPLDVPIVIQNEEVSSRSWAPLLEVVGPIRDVIEVQLDIDDTRNLRYLRGADRRRLRPGKVNLTLYISRGAPRGFVYDVPNWRQHRNGLILGFMTILVGPKRDVRPIVVRK